MKERQGFVFSIELTEERLYLKLFRLIPLSWLWLKDIGGMRVSSFNEHIEKLQKGTRTQYWPAFFTGYKKRTAPVYMLNTVDGKRYIFLRLSSTFHYRLRTAIGRKPHEQDRPPAPW